MRGPSHKTPALVVHSLSWDSRKHKALRKNTLFRTLIKTFLKFHGQMFPQRRQRTKPTCAHCPLFLTMLFSKDSARDLSPQASQEGQDTTPTSCQLQLLLFLVNFIHFQQSPPRMRMFSTQKLKAPWSGFLDALVQTNLSTVLGHEPQQHLGLTTEQDTEIFCSEINSESKWVKWQY